jgi:hypothetical protein
MKTLESYTQIQDLGTKGSAGDGKIKNWISPLPVTEKLVWGFLAIGTLLRLRQFLFDRSLWLDESFLALNIIHRSPLGLLSPLDYHQGAPLGFLILEKLVTLSLGSSEMALRLLPFVFGIASLFLFKAVAGRFLMPGAAAIAVGLFAILEPLIYYSGEVKQYSSDVAIALLLYLLCDSLFEQPVRRRRIVVFSLIAAIAIWFSHPSALILAGAGVSFLWGALHHNDRRSLLLLSVPGLLWLSSFSVFYLISLRGLCADSKLLAYWQDTFPPASTSFEAGSRWLVNSIFGLFSDPVGLQFTGIAAVAVVLGAYTFFAQNRTRFILLLAPVAFTLLASAFHRYPFRGRLLLFLVPSVILLIAAGLGTIRVKTRQSLPLLSVLLIGLLFFHPAVNASTCFIHPRTTGEIRRVIEYVGNHRLPGDILYLYYASEIPFKYYSERHLIEPMDVVVGRYSREDWRLFKQDLDNLRGKRRVWIFFSHVYPLTTENQVSDSGFDEERLFLDYLAGIGKRLDGIRAVGASAYLFDLGTNKSG